MRSAARRPAGIGACEIGTRRLAITEDLAFTVWCNAHDELYVTGPSRSYKQDGETKYYEFLRAKTKLLRDDFSSFVIAEYQRVIQIRAEFAEADDDVA